MNFNKYYRAQDMAEGDVRVKALAAAARAIVLRLLVIDLNSVGDIAQIIICLLLQGLTGHGLERLLYVDSLLGAGFKVRDSALL